MANNAERDQEISDLKSHIAALPQQQAAMLEQRLRALEPKPAPAPAHRPVSIQDTAPPPPSGMPTDQELQQLLAKVRERHPRFRPPAGTSEQALQEDFAAFRVAFRWLISIARTPEPNHKYDDDERCSRCYRFSQRISAGSSADEVWTESCVQRSQPAILFMMILRRSTDIALWASIRISNSPDTPASTNKY